jgi:hypothetical protein
MWADGKRSLSEAVRMGRLDAGLPEKRIVEEMLFLVRNGLMEFKTKDKHGGG